MATSEESETSRCSKSADSEEKFGLDLSEPRQELLDWARSEIGENPDTRCEAISQFRDMIYEEGECNPHRYDDVFLLRFLRARNFKVAKAHQLLVDYCDFKESNPEIFREVKLLGLRKIADYNIINVPNYKDPKGRRIILFKPGNWDPQKVSINELFQITIFLIETGMLEQSTQILGAVAIFDLGNISMSQAVHMTPNVANKIVQLLVTCFPLKLMAVHIVNQSWIFNIIFGMLKPILSERMKNHIFFHGQNMESLHQHIDPKHLPQAYGGIHEHQDYNEWMNFFKSSDVIMEEIRSLNYILDEVQ